MPISDQFRDTDADGVCISPVHEEISRIVIKTILSFFIYTNIRKPNNFYLRYGNAAVNLIEIFSKGGLYHEQFKLTLSVPAF